RPAPVGMTPSIGAPRPGRRGRRGPPRPPVPPARLGFRAGGRPRGPDASQEGPPMREQPVLVSTAAAVATVTLNRAQAMNSLDVEAKDALLAAVRGVAADPDVRAVVLAGTGRAFCVGQDLREFAAQRAPHSGGTPTSGQVFATVVEHYAPISE